MAPARKRVADRAAQVDRFATEWSMDWESEELENRKYPGGWPASSVPAASANELERPDREADEAA